MEFTLHKPRGYVVNLNAKLLKAKGIQYEYCNNIVILSFFVVEQQTKIPKANSKIINTIQYNI